jgi:hypothetical protein
VKKYINLREKVIVRELKAMAAGKSERHFLPEAIAKGEGNICTILGFAISKGEPNGDREDGDIEGDRLVRRDRAGWGKNRKNQQWRMAQKEKPQADRRGGIFPTPNGENRWRLGSKGNRSRQLWRKKGILRTSKRGGSRVNPIAPIPP